MLKSTITSWNPLDHNNDSHWQPIEWMEELAEELTLALALDKDSGDCTRLTRFKPEADASSFGRWLEVGDYASRPQGRFTVHLKQTLDVLF